MGLRLLKVLFLLVPLGLAASVPARQGNPVEDVAFKADCDGTEQRYLIRLPEGFKPRDRHDLMIALHGHGSDRHQFMEADRDECRAARDAAAERHMIYVCPDYRATTSWMGPKAEADVLQILRDLKRRYRVGRAIFCGASMGGSSVLTFAVLHPREVQGVVSMNGTANHVEYANFQDAIAESFGGTKTQVPEEYRKRSAEFFPERLKMPIAFTVGVKDDVVPPGSVLRLAHELEKLHRRALLIVDDPGGHFTNYENARRALRYVLEGAPAR